jgi:hypothetical protein
MAARGCFDGGLVRSRIERRAAFHFRNISGSLAKFAAIPPRLVAGQPVGGRAAMWLIVEIAERSAVRVVIQYSASEVALVGRPYECAETSAFGASFHIQGRTANFAACMPNAIRKAALGRDAQLCPVFTWCRMSEFGAHHAGWLLLHELFHDRAVTKRCLIVPRDKVTMILRSRSR